MTDEDGFSARSSSNGRDCSIAAGERAAWSPTKSPRHVAISQSGRYPKRSSAQTSAKSRIKP